jgi:23S rRNA pseudouridine1911/1915/1917 synthase
VKELLDAGRVFVGGRKVIIASWKVELGDKIQIQDSHAVSLSRRERYLKVYFEDQDLLVVEKPPGVACEKSPQVLTSTLVDDINDYLRRAHPDLTYPYVGLMHRLDRETSGVMVYTLSKRANSLAEQFRRHSVGRRYLALVKGKIKNNEGRIESGILKDPASQGRKMKVVPLRRGFQAHRSRTHFRVVERYPNSTLVEARLETGKTHQVRVHLASLGHPIIGDKIYGGTVGSKRLALHAAFLEFRHPVTHKKMTFRSEPPKDFQNLMERFRREAVDAPPPLLCKKGVRGR